jgi:ABC-type uncharacterized transport system substrate-binding protein
VELLKTIAPHVAKVAMLFNPASATYAEYWLKPFKAAAAAFGMEAISAPVNDGSELIRYLPRSHASRTAGLSRCRTPSRLPIA